MCLHSPGTPTPPLTGGSPTSADPDRWEERQTFIYLPYRVWNIHTWRSTDLVIEKELRCHWQEAKSINSWEEARGQSRGQSGNMSQTQWRCLRNWACCTTKCACTWTHQSQGCWSTSSNNCEGKKKHLATLQWSVSTWTDIINGIKPWKVSDLQASTYLLTFVASNRTLRKWHHWCTEDKVSRTNIWMPG